MELVIHINVPNVSHRPEGLPLGFSYLAQMEYIPTRGRINEFPARLPVKDYHTSRSRRHNILYHIIYLYTRTSHVLYHSIIYVVCAEKKRKT